MVDHIANENNFRESKTVLNLKKRRKECLVLVQHFIIRAILPNIAIISARQRTYIDQKLGFYFGLPLDVLFS